MKMLNRETQTTLLLDVAFALFQNGIEPSPLNASTALARALHPGAPLSEITFYVKQLFPVAAEMLA